MIVSRAFLRLHDKGGRCGRPSKNGVTELWKDVDESLAEALDAYQPGEAGSGKRFTRILIFAASSERYG